MADDILPADMPRDNPFPDDPRVNLPLHIEVSKAMTEQAVAFWKDASPMDRLDLAKVEQFKMAMRQTRQAVIDQHNATQMQNQPFRKKASP